ncbi:hypothetical protein [Microbacterium murale]|uniref:VapC45 PIN like domain-containing protein n=1 Tax=Microbacterium murale TaxID=1081040 RepID=A0ABQ1RK54_9MICO|nr:hypothetical protein [Microbacterium murale]GGD69734.1 hypothetical protein GCM10007269_11100 [Microbacterium murale]
MSPFSPVYFADENALGLAKTLVRQGRTDFVYPGHEALPEIPLGALDLEWMPIVGARGFIVITRDRRIRTRPAELEAYLTHGIRSVWIGAKQDLRADAQAELFLKHEARLNREIIKLGAGPWALALNMNGFRPLHLPSR